MERMICLDGVEFALDVDRVEIDLIGPGRTPSNHIAAMDVVCSDAGATWQPLMSFQDGSTLYLQMPLDGEEGLVGYRVAAPQPHRWNITLLEGPEKIAQLSWEAC